MTGTRMRRAVACFLVFVVAALLLFSSRNVYADANKIKDALLEKARAQLIARLEKTQPQLAGYFKQIDAAKWGRYAGEISAGNGQAVFEEILAEKKKEMDKLYQEMMDDLKKKGKEYAISRGVLGKDTETYLGWAEEYGPDGLAIAEKTYAGDFKGAGDIVINKMKEKLQVKTKELLTGGVTDTLDFFLKDLAGQSIGAIYLKILELELKKIEEFREYTTGYFGRFSVTPPGGRRIERDWCTQYMEMRKLGHDPDFSFNGVDEKTGLTVSIAEYITLGGRWYSTTKAGALPDAPTMIKQLELCYIHSKVPDKDALQRLIDAARANADRRLFSSIRTGMEQRKQQIIVIINGTRIPTAFSLVVTVEDADTGRAIPGAKVTLGGVQQTAPGGVATFTLNPDSMGDSIDVIAEASGYDSKKESFTGERLAGSYNTEKAEVLVKLSLKPVSKPSQVDEVDRFEVRCGANEIFEDDASACNATVYFKSGKSKDVSGAAKWTPDFVDAAKGTIKGQDAKARHTLPYTVTAQATYAAPAEEGGKPWVASDSVLVKPAAPVTGEAQAQIKIQKAPSAQNVKPGETVMYTYSVTNPGKIELGSVRVVDDKCSPVNPVGGDTNNNSVLDPGETWTYRCSAVLNTTTENTATVEAYTPKKVRATDKATAKVTVEPTPPSQVDEVDRFEVRCGPNEIFEDEAAICNAKVYFKSGKSKDANLDAKWTPDFVDNSKGTVRGEQVKAAHSLPHTVTVEATYAAPAEEGGKSWVAGDKVLVKPTAPVTGEAQAQIKIHKAPDKNYAKAGETVTYAYSVTNMGKVDLSSVKVADDKCSPVKPVGGDANKNNILDPGETWTYECSVVLNTTTENTATVEAYTPKKVRATDRTTVKVAVGPCPPPQIQIPYVLYMAEDDGKAELQKNRLKGDVTGREYSTRFNAGTIMDQIPPDGDCVDPDSAVGLVISRGPKPEEPSTKPRAALEAKLDCTGFLEVLPGEVSESCGVMVKNWNSNTTERVEVVFPQQSNMAGDLIGGIVVFPGSTSSDPTNMHVSGVQDANSPYYGWYTFSQGFSAKQDAKPGTSVIQIIVRQGDQQVELKLTVTVLPKGATRSTGPGLRPPAEVKPGSGGVYCVWRYKLIGDAPSCYHFHAAACQSYPSRAGYELVGQNMTFSEADARIGELSRYYSDQYGCEAVGPSPPEQPPPPPAQVKPGSGGTYCVWRYKLFGDPPACFHFHAAPCASYPSRKGYELVGQDMKISEVDARIQELSRYFDDNYGCQATAAAQPDCSLIAGSSPVVDKASGKIICECPPDKVLNKAGNGCIADPKAQVAGTDCSRWTGTVATWDPDTEQVTCECPAGTTWFNNACATDKDIKMAQANCSELTGSSPQWDEGSGQVKCLCPAGRRVFQNVCMTEKEILALSATGAITTPQADCSNFPGTSPKLNPQTGQTECACPTGTKWFNNACRTDNDIKLAQADCSSMPGTSPRLNPATGQVECVCPAGTKWFNNKCTSDRDITVAQADCSSMPGTSPRLNSSTGQVECVCPSGTKWFNNKCTSDRDVTLAQADCSSMPGTSPRLNSSTGQVECVCSAGTKWFNNACRTDNDIKLAQADCSSMPGTSPRLNSSTGQVECVCPSGTKWFNNRCTSDKDVTLSQADCSSMPGTSPRLNPQSGQVECVCPTGTKWFNNACVADKDIKLAQADCSSMPGTSPRLNPVTGQVKCVCPSGTKWFNNACVSDKDIKLGQADCSRFPGTSPQLDPTTGQVKCVCPAGTKWFNSRCTSDRDITVAQADCSRMPGTSPRLNPQSGQVECVCPPGTKWFNNRCTSDRDITVAQADCSSMPGTSPRLNSSTGQVECVCPIGTTWDRTKNRCLAPVPASSPPLPPKPPAPPKPTPPAPPKPGSAGQCDPPICIDMCKRNCQSFSQGAIDFCTHGCDKARACTAAEKDDAKSLAKVKAECYRNILTRCNQGQSGRTGDWCVGPGADKTCDNRAHSICGCDPKTHPQCGDKWD